MKLIFRVASYLKIYHILDVYACTLLCALGKQYNELYAQCALQCALGFGHTRFKINI